MEDGSSSSLSAACTVLCSCGACVTVRAVWGGVVQSAPPKPKEGEKVTYRNQSIHLLHGQVHLSGS